jgi:hypothetical protein
MASSRETYHDLSPEARHELSDIGYAVRLAGR